jgi:hypothetical protein
MSRARSKPTMNEGSETGAPVEQCVLVQEEVWRAVLDAARSDAPLSLGKQVRKIARGLPAAGFSARDIADALIYAAVDRGVAVEVTKPSPHLALDISGLFALVGRKRKPQDDATARPTFGAAPIAAAP